MSAQIVNLRRARKAAVRVASEAAAIENRIRHGRTGAERRSVAAEADRAARALDGTRLETSGGTPSPRDAG